MTNTGHDEYHFTCRACASHTSYKSAAERHAAISAHADLRGIDGYYSHDGRTRARILDLAAIWTVRIPAER